MVKFISSVFFILFTLTLNAQNDAKLMSGPMNISSINSAAPYISGDGNSMVYMSDYTESGDPAIFYTYRADGRWIEGESIPRPMTLPHLVFYGGYALNFDGSKLYFTTRKSGGAGGFDIVMTERDKNGNWENPTNFGLPINTNLHEACPTLTTDGNTMYFVRCTTLDIKEGDGCKLMVTTKERGRWSEPQEVPLDIDGNILSPRILADSKTMYFASDSKQGKGGYDLYMTKLENGVWSKPVPMDFINTDLNDMHVSTRFRGLNLIFDQKLNGTLQIHEIKIPDEFRPDDVLVSLWKEKDELPINARYQIYDMETKERLLNNRVSDEKEMYVVLPAGKIYNVILMPNDAQQLFVSRVFDQTETTRPRFETWTFSMSSPQPGDAIFAEGIAFNKYDTTLVETSRYTMNNLSRILSNNPDIHLSMEVIIQKYREDSMFVDQDLTELIIDTLSVEYPLIDSVYTDPDTIYMDYDSITMTQEIDTIIFRGIEYVYDSANAIYHIKKTYHNDRTPRQLNSLKEYLKSNSIDLSRINFKARRQDNNEEDAPKFLVKVKVE